MKTRLPRASRLLTMIAISAAIHPAVAQEVTVDGNLDSSFSPVTPDTPGNPQIIESLVTTSDGDIIATGTFTQIKSSTEPTFSTRSRVAKFTNGGALTGFAPNLAGRVLNASAEPDGTVLFAGLFTSANDTPRRLVARYFSDGSLDTSFTLGSPWNGLANVISVTSHRNGYLLSADAGLLRISRTGVNDSTFKPYYLRGSVNSTTLLQGGQFLINGPFGLVGLNGSGVNSGFLERLAPDGGVTTPAFTHGVNQQVYCSAVQADGRILVGGIFGPFNTPAYPTAGLTRLMPNGEPDEDFIARHQFSSGSAFVDGAVRSIAIQADGRILIAGDFTNIRTPVKQGGLWITAVRRGIARLYPDGSFDETFDAKIDSVHNGTPRVYGISLQADGKILLHGEFVTFNGSNRRGAARLTNYSATQNLTYEDGIIRWVRGGSAPETQNVLFEQQSVHTDFKWEPVDTDGMATREAATANWTKAAAIPPGSLIRASARIAVGQANASTSIVSSTIGYMMPELSLMRDDPPSAIIHNSTTSFPTTGVGSPMDAAFTLQNIGQGEMTPVDVEISGANASEFSVLIPPAAPIAAGGSAVMEIRFNPTSPGAKSAVVTVNTNDPFLPAFKFNVTGTAITALEYFRLTHFNTTANTGDAADDKDPDGDGLTNFFEFVAGMNPTDRTSTFTCRVDKSGTYPKAIFGPCLNNRTYEVWSSTSLNGDWAPAVGSTTAIGTQRTFTDSDASGTKRFYRVKIIRP
ncbi:MAG: choice-of-anchor D domain-containing protein [Akkermansiaceae bacterium]|nr:choice-of-anchor D domain-containing protein [Akkermansiaceae bacterium]